MTEKIGSQAVIDRLCRLEEKQIRELNEQLDKNSRVLAENGRPQGKIGRTDEDDRSYLLERRRRIIEEIAVKESDVKMLRNLPPGPFNKISVGCVVVLCDDHNIYSFLMVPQNGGYGYKEKNMEIKRLSCGAPLAKTIINRKEGETVECQGISYTVLMVQ